MASLPKRNRGSCSAEAWFRADAVLQEHAHRDEAGTHARMRARAPRGGSPQVLSWKAAWCCLRSPKSGSGSREAPSAGGVQGEMAPRWTGDLSGCASVPNPQDERGPRADRSGCSVPVAPGRASDSTA